MSDRERLLRLAKSLSDDGDAASPEESAKDAAALYRLLDGTDHERLVALLDEFGVKWQRNGPYASDPEEPNSVYVIAKKGPRQDGYSDFYTELTFTEDGDFVCWGCWE